MRAPLLALLLVGCGGGAYRQAAAPAPMVRPAPSTPTVGGYTPIGTGLPGELMPDGSARHQFPRNRESVKPTKGEDTVYAADQRPRKGYYPYEVTEPFREFSGDLRGLPRQCAAIMTEAIRKAVPGIDKRDVDTSDGICLDAWLLDMCVAKETRGRKDDAADRARAEAKRHVVEVCNTRRNDTSYVRRLVEATRKVYEG